MIPAPSAARTIAGKIVTMSNVTVLTGSRVDVQQALGRLDHDTFTRDIDRPADFGRERNQDFPLRTRHHEPAAGKGSLDALDRAHVLAAARHHLTANQLVV